MAQNTMIGGTSYGLSKGAPLINGTGYAVSKGRTLVSGTGYDIPLSGAKLASTVPVGESVYMNVNGARTEFLIVHQGNPDTSKYDDSCNGTWCLMKEIYELRAYSTWVSNIYVNSSIYYYLNEDFYALFDTNVQSVMREAAIPFFRTGYGQLETAPAKIFLLSAREVGYTGDRVNNLPIPYDGAKLDYFLSGDDTAARSKRNARYSPWDIDSYGWWFRTPDAGNTSNATYYSGPYLSADGSHKTWGVRPALILNDSVCVDEESNVVA